MLAVLSRESAFCFIPLVFLFGLKSKKHKYVRGIIVSLLVTFFYIVLRYVSFINYKAFYSEGNFSGLCVNPVIIICAANFSTAILLEAGLSFLGIGIQPPEPEPPREAEFDPDTGVDIDHGVR